MSASLPLIHLMLSPATLTSQGSDRLDMVRYSPPRSGRERLTGAELLAALPEIAQRARIDVDAENPHDNFTIEDIRRLALRANAMLARPEVDGLILVHGTNGLEETAYFLHLTLRTQKPVVVTGAQRPFTALSSDGAVNLLDAFRVATAKEAAGQGVLIVVNNQIHTARDLTKTSTYRLHTFQSRAYGILGEVDADAINFYRLPTRRHTAQSEFDIAQTGALPRVDILYVHAGARPDLVQASVDRGAEGIVVAGVGAGGTGEYRQELGRVVKEGRAVVVRSSRVGEGRIIADDNWQEPGMIAADSLSPHKAAILLALGLARTRDPVALQRLFDVY